MNKAIISGRFTREPEIRRTTGKDGQSLVISRGTIAVNRRGRQVESDQTADFVSIVAFGHPAEFIEKYPKQGTKIATSGRIQTGSYTNRDGQRIYTTDVVVENVEFAESKGASAGNGGQQSYQAARTQSPSVQPGDGFMNIPDGIDEELPFN